MRCAFVFAFSLALLSCQQWAWGEAVNSSKTISEMRKTKEFTRLVFELNGNLELQQAAVAEIQIEADSHILPHIVTEVVDSVLYIKEKSIGLFQSLKPGKSITVSVNVNNLQSLIFAGEGQLTSKGALQFDNLNISLVGAVRAELELKVNSLVAHIPGFGEYILKGNAKKQVVVLEGTGLFDGRNLSGDTASVAISGTGRVLLNVSEALHIDITGSGEVSYMGSPKVSQTIHGLGKVESLSKAL